MVFCNTAHWHPDNTVSMTEGCLKSLRAYKDTAVVSANWLEIIDGK